MKKLIAVVLCFLTIFTNLFPASARNQAHPTSQTAPQSASIDTSGLSVDNEWKMLAEYGKGIGVNGIIIQDLDGDGTLEIVAGGIFGGDHSTWFGWFGLHATSPNNYEQVWVSESKSSQISRLAVGDINNDGIAEILVGMQDYRVYVYVYRGTDFQQIDVFDTILNKRSMLVIDTDGNGTNELLISNDTSIAAYNPVNHKKLWSLNGYGGKLAAGDIDGDTKKEIVLSSGYVLNAATHAVEWHYTGSGGFGAQIEVGDVDGDGIDEIVGAAKFNNITVFDADLKSSKGSILTNQTNRSLTIADVNNDDRSEIIVGSDYFYKCIRFYDGQTLQELFKMVDTGDATALAVGDVDQDHSLELFWGTGNDSSGPDYFVAADISTKSIEWKSIDMDGPYSGVDIGDVDDDGQTEIVMGSSSTDNHYGDSEIIIFNAETHTIEWQTNEYPSFYNVSNIASIRIGDVDQDGQTEFVVAGTSVYDGEILIYNGKSHNIERIISSSAYAMKSFTALEIGDVDGDAKNEIVVGQGILDSDQTEAYVIVLDGATAMMEWHSSSLYNELRSIYDIDLKDLDGDGNVEILASTEGRSLYIIDSVTHEFKAIIPTLAYAISTADIDHDGIQSILVGSGDGIVEIYNGRTFERESTITLGSGVISCLSWVDLDQNTMPEWLACNSDRLSIYSTEDRSLLWQSQELGDTLGQYNQVPVGQIDTDDDLEILVGSYQSLYQFSVRAFNPFSLSSMTVSPKKASPGDLLTFTMTIVNNGYTSLPNVQVENPLPDELSYVPDTLLASSGTAVYADGKITWNGELGANSPVTLTYQATIKPDKPLGLILINPAQITAEGQTWDISAVVKTNPESVYLPLFLASNSTSNSGN